MKLLLDTHILIALIEDSLERRFPRQSAMAMASEGNFVSVATVWEIAIKARLEKLQLPFPISEIPGYLKAVGLDVLDINMDHALAELDPLPPTRDPFDRLLLAQCQVENMRLVTIDRALAEHPLAAR